VLIKITYIAELQVEAELISFRLPGSVAPWKHDSATKEKTQVGSNLILTVTLKFMAGLDRWWFKTDCLHRFDRVALHFLPCYIGIAEGRQQTGHIRQMAIKGTGDL
jgi:hypothetical protein